MDTLANRVKQLRGRQAECAPLSLLESGSQRREHLTLVQEALSRSGREP